MTESMKYYESIRRKYPETVSKDQFYQIAHISKATALHLLQNGLVPCKDTGKKTRRYTIRTDDIIFYLIDRELHPEVYRAPDRWYQERSGHYNSRVTYRNELTRLSEEERAIFRKYMEDEFCQYGDLLTIVEVAEAIGYCDTSLYRWCNAKKLKSFNISGKFLIPKISLVDFLVSQYSFDITRKTWKHTLLIKSFLDRLDIYFLCSAHPSALLFELFFWRRFSDMLGGRGKKEIHICFQGVDHPCFLFELRTFIIKPLLFFKKSPLFRLQRL